MKLATQLYHGFGIGLEATDHVVPIHDDGTPMTMEEIEATAEDAMIAVMQRPMWIVTLGPVRILIAW